MYDKRVAEDGDLAADLISVAMRDYKTSVREFSDTGVANTEVARTGSVGESLVPRPTPGVFVIKSSLRAAGPVPEFVIWVGAAVGSGVLGNAAYDALKRSLSAFLGRWRGLSGKSGRDTNSEALIFSDVELLVTLAIRIVRAHVGTGEPEDISITSATLDQQRRCWDIYAMDERDRYYFIVPTDSPERARLQGVMGPRIEQGDGH